MPQEAEPAPLPVSAPDLPANSWELDGWEAGDWEAAMAEMHNLPTDLESNEPPLESDRHREQIDLLIRLLRWYWREGQATPPPNYRADYYVSGNTTIYYSLDQQQARKFRGPDFFVVLGVENRLRKSWIVWQEQGQYPHVIVELLSPATAKVDRGLKKQLYQDTFRTPEYFWFDPNTLEFAGFRLVAGTYQPIAMNDQGWLWSQQLQLYLGVYQEQLRFFTPTGELVPTPEEVAETAQQQLAAERQRNERLIAQLRALGVDPDQAV